MPVSKNLRVAGAVAVCCAVGVLLIRPHFLPEDTASRSPAQPSGRSVADELPDRPRFSGSLNPSTRDLLNAKTRAGMPAAAATVMPEQFVPPPPPGPIARIASLEDAAARGITAPPVEDAAAQDVPAAAVEPLKLGTKAPVRDNTAANADSSRIGTFSYLEALKEFWWILVASPALLGVALWMRARSKR